MVCGGPRETTARGVFQQVKKGCVTWITVLHKFAYGGSEASYHFHYFPQWKVDMRVT